MKRLLVFNLAGLPEYDEASNYNEACQVKYSCEDDELWEEYVDIHARYVTVIARMRSTCKRYHITEEDLRNYDESKEDD